MAFRLADFADVTMALEGVLGADTGINGFAYQLESVTGTGTRNLRVYYVVVNNLLTPPQSGHPFSIVEVTLVPGIPRHSAVVFGTYYATMDAAVTAVGGLVLANAGNVPETQIVDGAVQALNS